LLALPAAVGVASIAHQIVPLILGPNWLDAVPVAELIALAGTLQVMQSTNYSVYLSVGKPARQALLHAIQLTVMIPTMIWLSSRYGLVGAAAAFTVSCIVTYPINLSILLPTLEARLRDYLRAIWRPAVAAAVMYVVLRRFAAEAPESVSRQLIELAQSVLLGISTYVAALFLCWVAVGRPHSTETMVLERLVGLFGRPLRTMRRFIR
jgi:PST family polysaccharide transporter